MGYMMKQRMIFQAVVLVMFVICLGGCAGGGNTAGGNTAGNENSGASAAFGEPVYEWGNVSGRTVTVWGRESDLNRIYMERAFGRYEELTGNKVKTVAFSPEEIEGAVTQAFSDENSEMDILLYFGGANLDAFDPDENFYDFSGEPWVEDLTNVSVNQAIYHGKVIGLPHWEASVSGTLYNKKIFKKLGISPPTTQAGFMEACKTLKKNGIVPLYLPCESPTMLLYQFPLDTVVDGDHVLEALNNGEAGYADLTEMHQVADWYRTMAEQGYLGENYSGNSWDGMSPALESGNYAMMLCWDTWLYTDYKGDPSDFGLMPAFMGVPEEGTFEGPNLSLLLVNSRGKQVDAALDLISFMADPYNYNAAFEGLYTAPVFRKQMASISTPQYVEAARWVEENYSDSVAWLKIRGFSQSDAVCILEYMTSEGDYTVEQCLEDMDILRRKRAGS